MNRPIEINYTSAPETNEKLYRISVFISIPDNKDIDIKHHLVAEYKKANIVDKLIERLNEY